MSAPSARTSPESSAGSVGATDVALGGRTRRIGPVVVASAPVVMAVALLAHPHIAVLPDTDSVASHVADDPTRWAVVHLLANLGIALVAAAFVVVHSWLRDAGLARHSRWGLPLVVLGSVVYGVLPGLEFAPLTASETGGDVAAVLADLRPWFMAALITGAASYLIGVVTFARDVADSRLLTGAVAHMVIVALLVMAAARAVPLGVVQLHVQAVAGLVALWPLAVLAQPRATGARR